MPEFDFVLERDVPELTGKVILITGGTAGLGSQTVTLLAKRNPARIYFTGRNAKTAEAVIQQARKVTKSTEIHFLKCDLTSLASVKQTAQELLAKESRLDVLMANAGIMAVDAGLTEDGYEVQFGTNHVGHALLIRKLLPLLEKTAAEHGGDARIITLTSQAWVMAPRKHGIVFDDLKTTQDYWFLGTWQRYGQSKLANALYGAELARRYPKVTTIVVNPGVVPTDLIGSLSWSKKAIVYLGNAGKFLKLEQGPLNQVWSVGVPLEKVVPGEMYDPVGVHSDAKTPFSHDKVLAGKLWDWTEKEIARFL